MDCGQVQSLFTTRHDGELDSRLLQPFERHLAACPQCAREWQAFQKTLRVLQGVRPQPVPPDLLIGIKAKLERGGIGTRLERALQKIFIPVPLKAAVSFTAAILSVTVLFKVYTLSGPETAAVSPPAQIAREEKTEPSRPPLVTLPVSLGRPEADFSALSSQLSGSDPAENFSSLIGDEEGGLSLLTPRDRLASVRPTAPSRWQIGPPLVPDVTIRMHHLSPAGMKWLHNRIKEEGRWQTRLYAQDYFLVVVEPGELSSLYHLLQRQHLPFSSHSLLETERAAQRPLLVAVRP